MVVIIKICVVKQDKAVFCTSISLTLMYIVQSSNNTSPLSDRLNQSTFYPGRTTYGGAASQRRLSLNATTPYQVVLSLEFCFVFKKLSATSFKMIYCPDRQ